jgi:tetratricopeptide (TPR) repeat protein
MKYSIVVTVGCMCLAFIMNGCSSQKESFSIVSQVETEWGNRQNLKLYPDKPVVTNQAVLIEREKEISQMLQQKNQTMLVPEVVYDEKPLSSNAALLSVENIILKCDQLLAVDPTIVDAYVLRGLAYFDSQFEQALDDFSQAIQLSPQQGELYLYRGKLYESQGESAKAMNDFSKAYELDTKFERVWLEAKKRTN